MSILLPILLPIRDAVYYNPRETYTLLEAFLSEG